MELRYISWKEVESLCKKLAQAIDESGFKPDLIIGVSRGGLVPARLVSDMLGIKELFSMKVEFYKGVGKTAEVPTITQNLPENIIKGKKVLVVDDVADTGGSLATIKKQLSEDVSELRTASLHFKPTSKVKPDFFVEETTAWLVYPWEIHETEHELKMQQIKRLHKTFNFIGGKSP